MEPDNPAGKSTAAPGAASKGECDHFQPADLARLAEEYLNGKSIPAERWEGSRFGYGAGGGSGPFKAVITEVERKKGDWVVVRLDRRKEALPDADAGFKVVRDAQ
ncbi:MAG: hypothetical protein JWP91_2964 [Fibrobacteres bacterium]|nr:hypothetical protein [Fibrobacterota bacterium]